MILISEFIAKRSFKTSTQIIKIMEEQKYFKGSIVEAQARERSCAF